MKLQDALFNWVQIKLVSDGRPDDSAAVDTEAFFREMLEQDFHINDLNIITSDEAMVHLTYTVEGKSKKQWYDREQAFLLLTEINAEPRYNL